MVVFTIGHSTRSAREFLGLLSAHGITAVADVRSLPRSRRHPHFSIDVLPALLAAEGIAYEHFPGLGGLRKPRPDSRNGGWRHQGFRAYADHMETGEFSAAVERLLDFAQKFFVAVMCAESQWWRCHRQLLADGLVARGVDVRHIMSAHQASRHELTPFARVLGSVVQYPALV